MQSLLVAFLTGMLALPAAAQDRLLPPAEFLGYELGSRFTPHHRVIDYVEHVAAHSPNVQIERYGETYEGRPLLVAYVSTPQHLARLDVIRENNLRRTGLLSGVPEDGPSLIWLSYNVHGNEAVSTESAMQVLYELADPANVRTQTWLEDLFVVIDPCVNPDGRERYVDWYTRTVGVQPNANPDAREHSEPWPGGRTNHYYFDLNRDWAWGTQQETQHRLALYNRWMPHVHVDFHEQGVDEPYYFAPAAEPFHEVITGWQRELQMRIGASNARIFDREGWLYFTRQVFDLFYPGYGDTWPTFNGAVGMTYEQGGSGRAGLAVVNAEGDTLRLVERITHHRATSLSTLETTAQNRAPVVAEFTRYFKAAQEATEGPAAYLVKSGAQGGVVRLAEHLHQQGIQFGRVTEQRAMRGYSYDVDATRPIIVEPGDLVVPAAQPKGVLARVLFEKEPALSDSISYDITAWALPYAYNAAAYALAEIPPFEPGWVNPAAAISGPEQSFAYLAEWKSIDDARFLVALLRRGIRPRFALKPFEIEGRRYEAGTLIVTRGNQRASVSFDAAVRAVAVEHGASLHGVASGAVTRGADFGSSDVPFLKKPRVALLAGSPMSSYAVGEVWHFFDQQLGYPLTLLDPYDLGGVNLFQYDVLILPSGSYGDVLTDDGLDELRTWLRQGGRLIALERAVTFLLDKDGFAVQRKDSADTAEPALEERLRSFAGREREAISGEVTGAIYRVRLDPTHPLAFGYGETYYTLKRSETALDFLKDGWNVGVLRSNSRVSGFAGAEVQTKLTDTLVFGVQEMGRGEIVYLVDNPLFRGFWEGGKLLFANAVFLVGQHTPAAY